MAHLHKKMKRGRPYYYVREIRRVDGKPKVVSQVYLGTPEHIAQVFKQGGKEQRPAKMRSEAFGALFVVNELEQQFDTIGLIDSVVPRARNEKGPSVGEYFFYAWANRLIAPKSKRALEQWYRQTAIQHIRPVALNELSSLRYWQKWEKVSAEAVEEIGRRFFERVWEHQEPSPECVMFDTTNVYSYLDSTTDSDLCVRGRSKDSKHHLRQVGLGLLVDRVTEIPMYFKTYAGNRHDSKLFHEVIDELFGVICGFNQTKQKLTVVFDKGMNSEENISFIDEHSRVHFITTYSPYFVEELAATALKYFHVLDTEKNRTLAENGKEDERVLAYRTTAELWERERSVIVTYNPRTYRKKMYRLSEKLDTVREALLEFRKNYRERRPHWRNQDTLLRRYERLCERLHIGSQYYQIEFGNDGEMGFRKNQYEIEKSQRLFGRNIIVSDNTDWSTEDIVQASLDRARVERTFQTGKNHAHVAFRPFFHWTDSKIRCQLLTCVIALTMSRVLEHRIKNAGIKTELNANSTKAVIEQMHALHSVLYFLPKKRSALRSIEDPTPLQREVLLLFGYDVDSQGVLHQAGV